MTIKHLIRKAKLQLIQEQYDHLFVFHCGALTNSQWRQFKHLLSLTQANTLFGTWKHIRVGTEPLQPHQTGNLVALKKGVVKQPCQNKLERYDTACNSQGNNTCKQQSLALRSASGLKHLNLFCGPICVLYLTHRDLAKPTLSLSPKLPLESGSLLERNPLFLCSLKRDSEDDSISDTLALVNKYALLHISQDAHRTPNWAILLHNISASSYNTSLILLYAQIQSTSMNHVDVQHAASLRNAPVVHSVIPSIQATMQQLYFVLSQANLAWIMRLS